MEEEEESRGGVKHFHHHRQWNIFRPQQTAEKQRSRGNVLTGRIEGEFERSIGGKERNSLSRKRKRNKGWITNIEILSTRDHIEMSTKTCHLPVARANMTARTQRGFGSGTFEEGSIQSFKAACSSKRATTAGYSVICKEYQRRMVELLNTLCECSVHAQPFHWRRKVIYSPIESRELCGMTYLL